MFLQIPEAGGRGYSQGQLQHRTNGHNTNSNNMDVIDTSLRVGAMGTGSREKLHPKHGFDEEQVRPSQT